MAEPERVRPDGLEQERERLRGEEVEDAEDGAIMEGAPPAAGEKETRRGEGVKFKFNDEFGIFFISSSSEKDFKPAPLSGLKAEKAKAKAKKDEMDMRLRVQSFRPRSMEPHGVI